MRLKEVLYNIRHQREKLNLSQSSIADELNLTTKSYSNIETGTTELTLSRFLKLSEILKTPPEQLLNPSQNLTINECLRSGYLNQPHFHEKEYEEAKQVYCTLVKHLEEENNYLRNKFEAK